MPRALSYHKKTVQELERMLVEADNEIARLHKVRALVLNHLRKDETNKIIRCTHCWFKTTPADALTGFTAEVSWGYEEGKSVFQCPNCKHISVQSNINDDTPPASDWQTSL